MKASKSVVPQERKQHDIDLVKRIYAGICPEREELQIKACFRLKSRDKQSDEAFPLKVCLTSKAQRRLLLTNSKKILELTDEDLKDVIIVRDLTADQRRANKKTFQEKKKRTESGDNVEVRFGEIVSPNSQRETFQNQ